MSRISQDLASQIAFKLTAKSRAAADLLKKEYQSLVYELYLEETPAEIKKMFTKYPEWFYTRQVVSFFGHGFRFESVTVEKPVIVNTSNRDANLTLTDAIANKLTKFKRKYEKADADCKELKRETEQALINLRTFQRIRENIPEAAPFLPPPMSNALVVNVDALNKKLAGQPKAIEKAVSSQQKHE